MNEKKKLIDEGNRMEDIKDLNKIANTEILNILKKIDYEYSHRVPIKFIKFLIDNSIEDEKKVYTGFDENGNIKISSRAEAILDYINLTYWASDEEKKELISIYKNNERVLNEKYEVDRIFKNKKQYNNVVEKEEKGLITVRKHNIIFEMFEKIRNWLKSKK